MKKVNSNQLGITGRVELSESIDTEKEAVIKGAISIYQISYNDNNDGTFDRVYKGKFTEGLEVSQGDKIIQGKDKRRLSQKLRAIIYQDGLSEGAEDNEIYYDIMMNKIIANYELIKEFIKDK